MKTIASLRYGVIFKKAFSRPDSFTTLVRDNFERQLNGSSNGAIPHPKPMLHSNQPITIPNRSGAHHGSDLSQPPNRLWI